MTTHTPPTTSIMPERKNISIPCFISGRIDSQIEPGSSHHPSRTSPAVVKAARSGIPKCRASRAIPMITTEVPSMKLPSCSLWRPENVMKTPATGTKIFRINPLMVLRVTRGSGMSRMARTMFSRLTRQDETRTTAKVRTIPRV